MASVQEGSPGVPADGAPQRFPLRRPWLIADWLRRRWPDGHPVATGALVVNAATGVLVLGLLVAVRALLDLGSRRTPESAAVAAHPAYDAWVTLLAATVVLWVGISVVLWRLLVRLFGRLSRGPLLVGVVGWALIAATIIVLLATNEGAPDNPVWGSAWKVRTALAVVFVSATPIPVGLWLSQNYVAAMRRALTAGAPDEADADAAGRRAARARRLLDVYDFIRASLTAASLGIAAAVVTTGALRNALLASGDATEESWPPSVLLVYGGFFTLVFAAVFVPALVQWRAVAASLVDDAFPVPPGAVPTGEWFEQRDNMRRLLHLDATVGKVVASAFGILAPLGTSLLAVFVPQLAT